MRNPLNSIKLLLALLAEDIAAGRQEVQGETLQTLRRRSSMRSSIWLRGRHGSAASNCLSRRRRRCHRSQAIASACRLRYKLEKFGIN